MLLISADLNDRLLDTRHRSLHPAKESADDRPDTLSYLITSRITRAVGVHDPRGRTRLGGLVLRA